jgi:tetratricopeptide (TPR) repeat protein
MFHDRADGAAVELVLTAVDMFERDKPFVFGLASLTDRVAIVSLARIGAADHAQFERRLTKLVLHEVGHTLGLHHHDRDDCVMRRDPTLASLDTAPDRPCEACHGALSEQADRLGRPGYVALDRARGHLMRGEVLQARAVVVSALRRGPVEPDVVHAFGMAFLEAGHYDESIGVFRLLARHDPTSARTHAALGLAYQLRADGGDRRRAVHHFERALALRPHWERVAQRLDGLQRSAPSAQGPTSEP